MPTKKEFYEQWKQSLKPSSDLFKAQMTYKQQQVISKIKGKEKSNG